MDIDVKNIATVAMTTVMYPQAVEPLQQVNSTITMCTCITCIFVMKLNKKWL